MNAIVLLYSDATAFHGLIKDAHSAFDQGLFDDKFNNISWIKPELKPEMIYREIVHIGSSVASKNITQMMHPIMDLRTNTNKILILSKYQALMRHDKKSHGSTKEGQQTKKQEFLLIMELTYKKKENKHSHDLGIFT